MAVHLITYGTKRFRHRQCVLGASARHHAIADRITHWGPSSVTKLGFQDMAPDIRLDERGSGYWAWKPFIILKALEASQPGDLIFYCDVGRRFPFKILNHPIYPFLSWMEQRNQSFMPGLEIAWRGPLSTWTKRDAFILSNMDQPHAWGAPTVQASFSLWHHGSESMDFVRRWLSMCVDRRMISDDPDTCGLPPLPGFHEHRHDQALLTLCCLKTGVAGFDTGPNPPPVDTRDPSSVLSHYFQSRPLPSTQSWKLLRPIVSAVSLTEKLLRSRLEFGAHRPSHPLAND